MKPKTKRKTNRTIKLPDGLMRAEDIDCQAPEWLWPNYLPSSALCSLEGEKGQGKGTLCYDLIAKLTTGKAMPLQTGRRDPAACILYSAEDHLNIVVAPKLVAAGADRKLIRIRDAGNLLRITPDLTALQNDIDKTEQDTGCPVKLVVIDPLTAQLDASIYNPQEFRKTAIALETLVQRKGLTILSTRHHTKTGTNLATRALGGVEVSNVQRSIIALVKVPPSFTSPTTTDSTRLFVPVVCDFVPPQPTLECLLTSTPVTIKGERKLFATLTWLGTSAVTMADLAAKSRATPKSDTACAIISNMLSDYNERDVQSIYDACSIADVSKEVTDDCATKLGVIRTPPSKLNGKVWTWRLPEPEPEEDT